MPSWALMRGALMGPHSCDVSAPTASLESVSYTVCTQRGRLPRTPPAPRSGAGACVDVCVVDSGPAACSVRAAHTHAATRAYNESGASAWRGGRGGRLAEGCRLADPRGRVRAAARRSSVREGDGCRRAHSESLNVSLIESRRIPMTCAWRAAERAGGPREGWREGALLMSLCAGLAGRSFS